MPAPNTIAWARALGLAGLIPFVAGTLAMWFAGTSAAAALFAQIVLGYGAVILSFVGAVLWGYSIAQPISAREGYGGLVLSVVPALVGWLSLICPASIGYAVQVGGFLGLHACERLALWCRPLPPWYLRLRAQLTAVVVAALMFAGAAAALR